MKPHGTNTERPFRLARPQHYRAGEAVYRRSGGGLRIPRWPRGGSGRRRSPVFLVGRRRMPESRLKTERSEPGRTPSLPPMGFEPTTFELSVRSAKRLSIAGRLVRPKAGEKKLGQEFFIPPPRSGTPGWLFSLILPAFFNLATSSGHRGGFSRFRPPLFRLATPGWGSRGGFR